MQVPAARDGVRSGHLLRLLHLDDGVHGERRGHAHPGEQQQRLVAHLMGVIAGSETKAGSLEDCWAPGDRIPRYRWPIFSSGSWICSLLLFRKLFKMIIVIVDIILGLRLRKTSYIALEWIERINFIYLE